VKDSTPTPRWLICLELALIAAAPFVYYRMPHEISSDGYLRLETTRYLALGQVIDQPVPMLFSIFALPLYHFGDVVALFNMVTLFVGLAATVFLLWRVAPADILRRFVLIVLAASMFGHHTQLFFGELLTAMMMAIAVAALIIGWQLPAIATSVLAVVNQPAAVPALFVMLLDRERGPFRLLKAAWPIAICALLMMLEFYLRRGDPLAIGYEGDVGARSIMPYSGLPGFSYPLVFGLLSLLFSFGKGLALYAPGLWLLFARPTFDMPAALRLFQRHSVWFLAGLVLIYAKWWAWAGGWFWGPRFLVFASIPASMALAIHLSDHHATPSRKSIITGLLLWSAWVGISGNVYGQYDLGTCNAQPNVEPLCWYSPEFSALFHPFIVPKPLSPNDVVILGYSVAAAIVLALPFTRDLAATAFQRPARRDRYAS